MNRVVVQKPDWRAVGAPPQYFTEFRCEVPLLAEPYLGGYYAALVIYTHKERENRIVDNPADEPVSCQGFGFWEMNRREDQRNCRQEKTRFLVRYAA